MHSGSCHNHWRHKVPLSAQLSQRFVLPTFFLSYTSCCQCLLDAVFSSGDALPLCVETGIFLGNWQKDAGVLRCMKGISESGTCLCVQRRRKHGELCGDALRLLVSNATPISSRPNSRFFFTRVLVHGRVWQDSHLVTKAWSLTHKERTGGDKLWRKEKKRHQ